MGLDFFFVCPPCCVHSVQCTGLLLAGSYTASVIRSLAHGTQHLLAMLKLDGCLDTLMENTFNQVGDIFGGDFDDLDMEHDSVDQNLVTIDSRLDIESVLIEDIKFDLDTLDSRLTDYANYQPQVLNSETTIDEAVHSVNKDIKHEANVDNDENTEPYCPQQRDRCNTWPRQIQGGR